MYWCYALEWASRTRSLTALDLTFLKSRTPEERIVSCTPDISEYAYHGWFDWIWYKEGAQFPEQDVCLGRWLGIAANVGQSMMYWVLTGKGTVIARSSVIGLIEMDRRDINIIQKQQDFMKKSQDKSSNPNPMQIEVFPDVQDNPAEPYTSEEIDSYTPEQYNEYISAKVMLPIDDSNHKSWVL